MNYNWSESTQLSSPKGLYLKMVLYISPVSGPHKQDCEELINHVASSSGAALSCCSSSRSCELCVLQSGWHWAASLFLLIQGMRGISPGCLGAVFLQLSWKDDVCYFFYSLSPTTGSGVTQSTTKKGFNLYKIYQGLASKLEEFQVSPKLC